MSRKKSRSSPGGESKNRSGDPHHARSGPADRGNRHAPHRPVVKPSATREIVESVVIAFVLAFLFRTFEAEAFVIPTGSMAPTLMGRHKDLYCEECGYHFQVSASDEIDSETNRPTGRRVEAATCPNCRHTMYVGPDPRGKRHPSYKGDRILVAKFPYRFADPERWDVAVFKFPGKARTNFIKRIVGLPGETIRIEHGDLFVKNGDRDGWHIARKTLRKARAMMRTVYDNDYVQREIVAGTWPARWGDSPLNTSVGWAPSKDYKAFRTDGSAGDAAWLEYRHLVPSFEDWNELENDPSSTPDMRPQLITDFAAYNTDDLRGSLRDIPAPSWQKQGLHWVGDLAVECEVEVQGDGGQVVLELVEGSLRFQCRFDVATGTATLGIEGLSDFRPTAQTALDGPGTYRVFFANFDDKLFLSVDGREAAFDAATTFGRLDNERPTRADLAPVRIGSAGATVQVAHLKVYRDIYYIAENSSYNPAMTDFKLGPSPYRRPVTRQEVAQVQSDPREWGLLASSRGSVQFVLGEGQFLALGDNSAESKDSRLWGAEYYVSRELLIGKALVIYWPHSLDRIPGTNIPIRFFPNFQRMRLVR